MPENRTHHQNRSPDHLGENLGLEGNNTGKLLGTHALLCPGLVTIKLLPTPSPLPWWYRLRNTEQQLQK